MSQQSSAAVYAGHLGSGKAQLFGKPSMPATEIKYGPAGDITQCLPEEWAQSSVEGITHAIGVPGVLVRRTIPQLNIAITEQDGNPCT